MAASGIVLVMIQKRAFLLALALCLFPLILWFSAPGQAQQDDESRLKAVFGKMMEDQKKSAAAQGNTLTFEGDIQIEKAENYYAVTLPHAGLKTKEGDTLEIGMIAINASAGPQPASWKMTIALPTPFTLKDKEGKPLMTLAIGTQKATGIWNEKIGYFTGLDAVYGGISVTDTAKSFSATLGSLAVKSDLTETSPGKWSGPMSASLENLEVLLPAKQTKILLKSGVNKVDLLAYDPALIRSKQASLTAPANANMAMSLFDLFTKSGEGFKTEYSVEGLEIVAPQPGQTAMGKFGLDRGSFSLALNGFGADKVNASLALDYRGLDPRPLSEQLKNVMPKEAHLDWELKDVPLQQITATVQNTMGAGAGAGAQLAMVALVSKLSALMSQSKTSITVDKNYVLNDLYRADLNGSANADITALLGFSADAVLGVYGLDNLITALENAGIESTTMYRTTIQSWAASLKYFKGFGVMQKDPEGSPLHRYHFQVTPQGKLLLNDKDAAALLSGGLLPPVPGDAAAKPAVPAVPAQ
jgi:hypothetical protein